MKTIEKCRPLFQGYRAKTIEPVHSHRVELARMSSRYFIFRSDREQQWSRQDDFDIFCRALPEIVKRAKDYDVSLAFSGYTAIDGKSNTIIEAQGSIGQLTDFADYNTTTLLTEYGLLLDHINKNLIINNNTGSYHYTTVLKFCPHQIKTLRTIEKNLILENNMSHVWAEWENGYCFRNPDDRMLAAMLIL
jgi:hypothetical protein